MNGAVWVSGFEAFRDLAANPTAWIVERLAADPPVPGLRTLLLPVAYREAERLLDEMLAERPAVWLGLGVHKGARGVEIERVGLNLDDSPHADSAAETRRDQSIRADGPAAYLATLPVAEIRAKLVAAGIPATLSRSAGGYLCNHALYYVLDRIAQTGLATRAGFLHLPLLPAQAAREEDPTPSMAPELELAAVRLALFPGLSPPQIGPHRNLDDSP